MTGKSHITMNLCTATVMADAIFLGANTNEKSIPYALSNDIKTFVTNNGTIPLIVFITSAMALYILGSILPDIDHPYSMIGKIIYIPIEHRTWTHAIYIPIILCIASIKIRLLLFLGLGMFLHDFWDAFSTSGIHWLYPKKMKHRLKLYHTGTFSEYIFVALFIMITILITLGSVQHVFQFVNVSFT